MVDLGASLSRVGTAPVDTSISQDSGRKAVITSMDTVADSLDRNSLLVGFSTGQGMYVSLLGIENSYALFHVWWKMCSASHGTSCRRWGAFNSISL